MFKKKQKSYENVYDRHWNEIVNRRFDIMGNIDKLYEDIKCSLEVLLCFKEDSPNWNAENKHLQDLRYKMLCECGSFDGTSYDLRELWQNSKDKLQPKFCMEYTDLTVYPPVDCNTYLRSTAKIYNEYE